MNANITVVGNIGKEPEIKFLPNGKGITSLSVAVTPRYRSGDEWVDDKPIWFKATFFDKKAEQIVDTYTKGQRISLTGQFVKGQPWTDKQGVHHDGGWEIGNAEVELKPWESKAKTDTAPPTSGTANQFDLGITAVTMPESAPF